MHSRSTVASLLPTAELEITVRADIGRGSSWLERQYHKAPLKVAKTFALPNRTVGLTVMDVSPGMMDGDSYSLNWLVGAGAGLYATNQSFTKVHPSRGRGSCQRQTIRLERSARFVYRPEPVMLYHGAELVSETEVHVAPDSLLLMTDIVCGGRRLRGERFEFGLYDSLLRVSEDDELIFVNRQRIVPSDPEFAIDSTGGWNGSMCQGSLYLFSDRVGGEQVSALHHHLELCFRDVMFGVSETYKHGIMVLALSSAVWPLQELLQEASNWLLTHLHPDRIATIL